MVTTTLEIWEDRCRCFTLKNPPQPRIPFLEAPERESQREEGCPQLWHDFECATTTTRHSQNKNGHDHGSYASPGIKTASEKVLRERAHANEIKKNGASVPSKWGRAMIKYYLYSSLHLASFPYTYFCPSHAGLPRKMGLVTWSDPYFFMTHIH